MDRRVLSVFAIAAGVALYYWNTKKPKGTVKKLYIYPVKSCYPIEVQEALLDENGLMHDRQWVVAAKGESGYEMISQRTHPKMTLIKQHLNHLEKYENGGTLTLEAIGMDPLVIPFRIFDKEPTRIKVWKHQVAGQDEGDLAAQWLSTFLGTECRLFRKDPRFARDLNPKHTPAFSLFQYQPQTGFADGYPLLVVSDASIKDVQQKTSNEITAINFRPNIVLDGLSAWEEDEWIKFTIDQIGFFVNSRCTRCNLPCNNPETAQVGKEPFDTLQKYRRVDPGSKYESCVGVNATHTRMGRIRVGDSVHVNQFGSHDRTGIWNHGLKPVTPT